MRDAMALYASHRCEQEKDLNGACAVNQACLRSVLCEMVACVQDEQQGAHPPPCGRVCGSRGV